MKVGTVIKAFDFPGHDDCYMIGKVISIEGDYITCDTWEIVFEGEKNIVKGSTHRFRTVKQGCMMFDSKFQRVVELSQG
jgi:hypothetical protein